jgi:hypothetical protein
MVQSASTPCARENATVLPAGAPASRLHFAMKLFLAAPASGFPSFDTALLRTFRALAPPPNKSIFIVGGGLCGPGGNARLARVIFDSQEGRMEVPTCRHAFAAAGPCTQWGHDATRRPDRDGEQQSQPYVRVAGARSTRTDAPGRRVRTRVAVGSANLATGIASPVVGIVKVGDPIAGKVTGKLLWMSYVLPRP